MLIFAKSVLVIFAKSFLVIFAKSVFWLLNWLPVLSLVWMSDNVASSGSITFPFTINFGLLGNDLVCEPTLHIS